MRPVRLVQTFLFVAVSLFSMTVALPTSAQAVIPNRLEIMRTPKFMNGITHQSVTYPHVVLEVYTSIIALPVAPTDQICPMYIIASYQLTFFRNNTIIQKVKALNGQCQPVTIGSNDTRTGNAKFWGLVNKLFKSATVSFVIPIQQIGNSSA